MLMQCHAWKWAIREHRAAATYLRCWPWTDETEGAVIWTYENEGAVMMMRERLGDEVVNEGVSVLKGMMLSYWYALRHL